MKTIIYLFSSFIFTTFLYGQIYGDGHFNPDSLETVTVSGIVNIDSAYDFHPVYFLDENGDNQADYTLNFGPFWYQPDSSISRPADGDSVTVFGGLAGPSMMIYDMLIVYEMNGEIWREPFEPLWNNFGMRHMGMHYNECRNSGYRSNMDSLKIISLSGTVFLDTTLFNVHYYLDDNNDSIPDYLLNFGPPWYEPETGAVRPVNRQEINITGAKIKMPYFDMIIVYQINGLLWRDYSEIKNNFGGGWMHRNSSQPQKFHSPFDDEDFMIINPGWHMGGGMHGGMMMPDSIYAEMLEVYPENLPDLTDQNVFAGYQLNIFYPEGQNGMLSGHCGGMMRFNNNINFQLHYNDKQFEGSDENSVKVKYYDDSNSEWVELPDYTHNVSTNVITFSDNEVFNFLILTKDQETTGISNNNVQVKGYKLFQNYPNPFNPETNISFYLEENSEVVLSVFNILGQKVTDLVKKEMSPGNHTIRFDAGSNGLNLPSGIYFYKLSVGQYTDVKKMELIK